MNNLCHETALVPAIQLSTVAVIVSLKLTSRQVFPLTPNLKDLL